MNLILLIPDDFKTPDHVILHDYRADHIRTILRSYVGQSLKVGLLNGPIGEAVITSLSEHEVILRVTLEKEGPSASGGPSSVSLLLALPRPQTLKKVLESTAAFGVHHLILVGAEQVEKSFFSSKLLKDKVWEKHQRLGLEQGGKTFLPQLQLHQSLRSFLEKELPQLHPQPEIKIVCHPGEKTTLWETALSSPHQTFPILCALGPEGGWRDEEVTLLESQGFERISLGTTIHRVENAVVALLSQIEFLQTKFLNFSRPPLLK